MNPQTPDNEVARLREELAEIKDGMKFIMDEKCAESEVHCGCVPLLKISFKKSEEEVARLRAFIKSIMPPPPYGQQEPEWRYAEKLLAETAAAPEEPNK